MLRGPRLTRNAVGESREATDLVEADDTHERGACNQNDTGDDVGKDNGAQPRRIRCKGRRECRSPQPKAKKTTPRAPRTSRAALTRIVAMVPTMKNDQMTAKNVRTAVL